MKTAEEYLNSKGFYNTNVLRNTHHEEVKITDMLREYATEAIKADRERIKAVLSEKGAIDMDITAYYTPAANLIDNLPIELK